MSLILTPELMRLFTIYEKISSVDDEGGISYRCKCIYLRDHNGRTYSVPIEKISDGTGIKLNRLVTNLYSLYKMGLIKINTIEKNRIEIELTKRLKAILEVIDDHDLVFTINHLKVLLYLLINSFDQSVASINNFLEISERGARKVLKKLIEKNFITEKSSKKALTDKGIKILDNILVGSYPNGIVGIENTLNPFHYMSLIEGEISSKTIKQCVKALANHIRELLANIQNYEITRLSETMIIGLGTSSEIPFILNYVASTLGDSVIQVPIVYDKIYFKKLIREAKNQLYFITYQATNVGAGNQLGSRNNMKHLAPIKFLINMFSNATNSKHSSIMILVAPYIISYVINRIVAQKSPYSNTKAAKNVSLSNLLTIFRIDRSLLELKNNTKNIIHESEELYHRLAYSLLENKTLIEIEWNNNYDYRSYIRLGFKNIEREMINKIIKVENGSLKKSTILSIPIGELKIQNLPTLIRQGKLIIEGKINILGEPITGIKPATINWLSERKEKPEMTINIKTAYRRMELTVKSDQYKYPTVLSKKINLSSIHLGINELKRKKQSILQSPITLEKTRHFMHIELTGPSIFNPTIKENYTLYITNANLYINEEKAWKTT